MSPAHKQYLDDTLSDFRSFDPRPRNAQLRQILIDEASKLSPGISGGALRAYFEENGLFNDD
jgi:hypothetical protein